MSIEDDVRARFARDGRLRRMWGVNTDNPADPVYQMKLKRLIAAEVKCAADQKRGSAGFDSPPGEDVCARALKNCGYIVPPDHVPT